MRKKILLLNNLFKEYGMGGVKLLIYKKRYQRGLRDKNKMKGIFSKTVGNVVFFRPYTTDIYLMIDLLCRPLDDGGTEYQIDDCIIGKNPQLILDAGANIGLFTLMYKSKFPQAQFVCVEPDEENFRVLQRNVGRYSNVKCVLGGLWNNDCYLKNKDRGTGEWGITVEECSREDSSCRGYSILSLMSMVSEKRVNICKIDIEGSEAEVFEKNYEDWIKKVDCYIIEMHDRIKPGVEDTLLKLFKKYGYKHIRNGENTVFYREKNK